MTEAEWKECADTEKLISWLFFDELSSDRKLRLFSVACCRPVLGHLGPFTSAVAHFLELIEGLADESVSPEMLKSASLEISRQWSDYKFDEGRDEDLALWAVSQFGFHAAGAGALCAEERTRPNTQYRRRSFYHPPFVRAFPLVASAQATSALIEAQNWREGASNEANEYQRFLLHEIFGNPFCPVVADQIWLTSTVLTLATGIYQDRAFDRMPILADALQDAGCDNNDVLSHCRQLDQHVRGCWVIDLLLGKS